MLLCRRRRSSPDHRLIITCHHLTSSTSITYNHHHGGLYRFHATGTKTACCVKPLHKTRHDTDRHNRNGFGVTEVPVGFPCTGVKGARSSAWRRGYSAVSGGTCGVAWGASRTVARPLATTGTLRGCILAFFPLTGVVLGVWWRVGEIGCRGLSFPFF